MVAPSRPRLAHLGHDRAVEALLAIGLEDARHELILRVAARGIAHQPLLLGEKPLEVERIGPVEAFLAALLPRLGLVQVDRRFRHGRSSPVAVAGTLVATGGSVKSGRSVSCSAFPAQQPLTLPRCPPSASAHRR